MATNGLKWYGDEFMADVRQATPDALLEVAEKFIEVAASRAPRGDGDLRRSGYVKSENKSTYTKRYMHSREIKAVPGAVGATFAAFYTHMVEFGTRSHTIKSRKGRKLRMANGNVVTGPVSHPGTRARPFIRPTIDEAKSLFGDMVAQGVKSRMKSKK